MRGIKRWMLMGWALLGSFALPIGLAVANENPIVPDAAAANAAVARAEAAEKQAAAEPA